ncbi:MAG: hypothetical protein ACYDAO_02640 [Thermoplasmataceae archaeon]
MVIEGQEEPDNSMEYKRLHSLNFSTFPELVEYIHAHYDELHDQFTEFSEDEASKVVFSFPISVDEKNWINSLYIELPVRERPRIHFTIPADFISKESADDKEALNTITNIAQKRIGAWKRD